MKVDLNSHELATIRAALLLWLRDGAHIAANEEIFEAFDAGPGLPNNLIPRLINRLPQADEAVGDTRDPILLVQAIAGITPEVSLVYIQYRGTLTLEAFASRTAAETYLHRTIQKAMEGTGLVPSDDLQEAIAQLKAQKPDYEAIGLHQNELRGSSQLEARPILAIAIEGGSVTAVYSDELAGTEVVVIDYDISGADQDKIHRIPQGSRRDRKATVDTLTVEMNQTGLTVSEIADLIAG